MGLGCVLSCLLSKNSENLLQLGNRSQLLTASGEGLEEDGGFVFALIVLCHLFNGQPLLLAFSLPFC